LTRKQYRIRAEARRDLDGHIDFLLVEAGEATAARFIAAARQSFGAIAESPGMGVALESSNLRLIGMRKWRIRGFPKYLIFYQASADAIRIVRVLHAAQDWWALLDVN
jgi:toxin ParE1/3/4